MNEVLYQIKATETFAMQYKQFFDKEELMKFNKFKERLKTNPYLGDQLRVPYVREFKTDNGRRAYFLIYDDIKIILFVAFSNKKKQKTTINRIFEKLEEFKEYTYKYYKS